MNRTFFPSRRPAGTISVPFLAFVATVLVTTSCHAAPPSRPPLHLSIDPTPIDRNAAERVSYAPIVKKTAASVVYVFSTKTVKNQSMAPLLNDPLFRQFFGVPGLRGGQLPEQTQHALGSGIIISSDGYVLTNYHVVQGADEVRVQVGESNKRYDAKIIGTDSLADIAVLKIEDTDLKPATFGDSNQLEVGDVVFAIGDPFGIGQSVSRGIVSALGRGPGIEAVEDFIQTDAAINPGNSGGALIDSGGRVVGIDTAILSGSGGFAGVGFAIPINLVRRSAEQIITSGHVTRGFLGVAPQELTPDLADQFKIDKGALVAQVTAGSPADRAGLQAGDVITKINGAAIRDDRHLLLTVSQLAPGTEVTIEYTRNGKTQTATAKLGSRPDHDGGDVNTANNNSDRAPNDVGVLTGVGVGDITPDLREQLQIPPRVQGAVITNIDPGSPAAQQGLREGDVIEQLDRRPIHSAEEMVRISQEVKGPKVMVLVWRQGASQYVVIDESQK